MTHKQTKIKTGNNGVTTVFACFKFTLIKFNVI